MKIHHTFLGLPCLFIFAACDSDSDGPALPSLDVPEKVDAAPIVGETLILIGTQREEVSIPIPAQNITITNEGDLEIEIELNSNETDANTTGFLTYTFYETNSLPPNPEPGDTLPISRNEVYSTFFIPLFNTRVLTITNPVDPVLSEREISLKFLTPTSGTWTQSGSGETASGETREISGSGTFSFDSDLGLGLAIP